MGTSTLIIEIGCLLSMVTFSYQVQCRGTEKEFAFKFGCERKMCLNETWLLFTCLPFPLQRAYNKFIFFVFNV